MDNPASIVKLVTYSNAIGEGTVPAHEIVVKELPAGTWWVALSYDPLDGSGSRKVEFSAADLIIDHSEIGVDENGRINDAASIVESDGYPTIQVESDGA